MSNDATESEATSRICFRTMPAVVLSGDDAQLPCARAQYVQDTLSSKVRSSRTGRGAGLCWTRTMYSATTATRRTRRLQVGCVSMRLSVLAHDLPQDSSR